MIKNIFNKIDPYPWLFAVILCVFYPELLTAAAGPLVSDHWEQHYPWAFYLSQFVKQWSLPFWTTTMQSGYPIAAESQIGIFYLPNLLLSYLFPIHVSYSYTSLLHYLFSGLGCYYYLKNMDISKPAAFLSACIFVFGTAYGGAYYNITSLKTISWLPWLFLFFEKCMHKPNWKWPLLMSFSVGMCLVAGYLQVAALTMFYLSMYAVVRIIFEIKQGRDYKSLSAAVLLLLISGIAGILIAMPQILMTFQLAIISNRTGTETGYAYVGSLSPLAFGTLIFPITQSLFRGNCLYQGVLSVFLLSICFFYKKSDGQKYFFKLWLIMLILAILFALGRWSPLYVAIVETTGFSSFRTPAKFLIFIHISCAFLAGLGADLLFKAGDLKNNFAYKVIAKRTFIVLVALCVVFTAAYLSLIYFRTVFNSIGHFFVAKFIHNQPGHPHSMEFYEAKLTGFIDFAIELLNPGSIWFIIAVIFIVLNGLLFAHFLPSAKNRRAVFLLIFMLFMADVFTFSFKDMKTDFAKYSEVEMETPLLNKLMELRDNNEIGRIYSYRNLEQPLDMLPSNNMLYGIDDIGGYSPLIMKRYHESIGLFGNTNDSNASHYPDPKFIYERFPLLESLNVTHIVSARRLHHPKLQELFKNEEQTQYLYALWGNPQMAFFVKHTKVVENWEELKEYLMAPGFDPKSVLLLEAGAPDVFDLDSDQMEKAENSFTLVEATPHKRIYGLNVASPGYFVIMQSYFPGWEAHLNSINTPIHTAYGLFQAVRIDNTGQYTLELNFNPLRSITGEKVS